MSKLWNENHFDLFLKNFNSAVVQLQSFIPYHRVIQSNYIKLRKDKSNITFFLFLKCQKWCLKLWTCPELIIKTSWVFVTLKSMSSSYAKRLVSFVRFKFRSKYVPNDRNLSLRVKDPNRIGSNLSKVVN